ncbi:MAG: ABC transporter permease [Spirochaetaceae bacterium]|jgi:simple sugar transport system permease protein|nr:ABC transporter permease [Spirochaetaceae bacterium]
MVLQILFQAVPLLLAGTGVLWTELAGFLSISIEGWMSFGGFVSYIIALYTGSVFWAVIIASLAAAFLSWLCARFVIRAGADPFIVGLALNLGISGGITAVSSKILGAKGVLRPFDFTGAANSELFSFGIAVSWSFVYAAVAGALISAWLLRRTPLGLRTIAAGLSPEASLERGLDFRCYRTISWAFAGFFAAAAGAALTFRVGVYTPDGVSGRGWLAIAAVFLGFRKIRGIIAASVLLAAAEHVCIDAQKQNFAPQTALIGLPSLLALLLYSISQFMEKKIVRD